MLYVAAIMIVASVALFVAAPLAGGLFFVPRYGAPPKTDLAAQVLLDWRQFVTGSRTRPGTG